MKIFQIMLRIKRSSVIFIALSAALIALILSTQLLAAAAVEAGPTQVETVAEAIEPAAEVAAEPVETEPVTETISALTLLVPSSASGLVTPQAPPITPATRSLGTVTNVAGPSPICTDSGLSPRMDGECYKLTISCTQLVEPWDVEVKVSPSTTTDTLGTILFASGFNGSYYWEDETTERIDVLNYLRDSGYRVAQLYYLNPAGGSFVFNSWFQAATGERAGTARLACRAATASEWVYQSIHSASQTQAYCASGHSNGATQMALTVSQYGMADKFAHVLLESGPNWSRVDHICIQSTDPKYAPLYDPGSAFERNLIDVSLGFGHPFNVTPGFCTNGVLTETHRFEEMSITYNNWQFVYPRTNLHFIFGSQDATKTRLQGYVYHDRVVAGGTPYVISSTVAGAGHYVVENAQGGALVRSTLVNECVAAVAPTATISSAGIDVFLDWMTDTANLAYEMHVSSTPYFTPDGTTLTDTLAGSITSYADLGAVSNVTQRYYVLRGARGGTVAAAAEVGMFKFTILPGS